MITPEDSTGAPPGGARDRSPARLAPGRTTPRVTDGVLLAGIAFAIYAVCGRAAFHGIDAHYLMWCAHGGILTHEYHTFYLPAVALVRAVLEPLGGTLFQAGLLVSAAGAAVGVLCAHRASTRIGLDRASAAFAAVLLAALPAIAFFATIVEVHGLAVAFASVAWLAIASWCMDPRPARAVLVGLALVLAFLAHPSAAPLGAAMAPAILLVRRDGWIGPLLRDGAIALAVLVAGIGLVPPVLRALGGWTDAGLAFRYLADESVRHATLGRVGRVLWSEWLLGLMPTGLVLALLAVRSTVRSAARASLLAVIPFVVIAWLMLEDFEYEYGAYAAAVAWPMVAVVAVAVRSRVGRIALVVAAVAATVAVASRCVESPKTRNTAEVVRAEVGDSRFYWLIGDRSDLEAWLVHHGDAGAFLLSDLLAGDGTAVATVLPILEQEIRRRTGDGQVVIVTDNAFRLLDELHASNPSGVAVLRRWLTRLVPDAGDTGDGVACHRLVVGR